MTEFEQWVNELDKLPKIETYCVKDENDEPVLVNGKIIEAQTIKIQSYDRAEVERHMIERANEIMKDNKVWIRHLPSITEHPHHLETTYTGRARIAVSPL